MFFRQGDVLIQRIPHVKGSPTFSEGDIIIAKGEVTGHTHRFKTNDGIVELYKDQDNLYVKVLSNTAIITHEEHKPIEIPKGDYEIITQRQYEPDGWVNIKD